MSGLNDMKTGVSVTEMVNIAEELGSEVRIAGIPVLVFNLLP